MKMVNNNKKIAKKSLFDEKLWFYEDLIANFFADIAEEKRVNPKMMLITSYLLIYGKLTQKQLKTLTGFSLGTISTYLTVMLDTEVITKHRIPSTHAYIYSISGNSENWIKIGLDIAIKGLIKSEEYLKVQRNKLDELRLDGKKGAEHLIKRIDQIFEIFLFYTELFPEMIKDD